MLYEITIEGNETIEFTMENVLSNKITDVEFKSNTIDDDTLEHDSNARCEFVIKGKIDEKSNVEVLKIAKWSIEKEDVHRKLKIKVYDQNNKKVLRTYIFDRIFCIDYSEKLCGNDLTFELYAAQSKNKEMSIISD